MGVAEGAEPGDVLVLDGHALSAELVDGGRQLRRAGLISLVATSSANRSSASSIASASNDRVTATRVAVRRGSNSLAKIVAERQQPPKNRAQHRAAG